jgi:superfamily II DNA/RNA helicase
MQNKVSIEDILSRLNIESLNEMQHAALQSVPEHDNVMILSATGSGKTLAFLLPLLNSLQKGQRTTTGLILVPTRELALQIEQVFRSMGTGFKITSCYGGHKREIEEQNLVEPPALIVGTPGRVADHLRRNNITASSIEMLVLDEFDKSLELGFVEEIQSIIEGLPGIKKRILTSATSAVTMPAFLPSGFHQLNFLPEEGQPGIRLDVQVLISAEKDKTDTLFRLLCLLGNRPTIIFCNHREAVERTSSVLSQKGITNTFYHGAMEQREREVALAKFRNGSINFLVTTDLASRGLDIAHIRYIIHYHLPATEDIFTHRNGRTARMDASGTAIVICGPDEKLPDFIQPTLPPPDIELAAGVPEKPKWTTFFVGAGKKDKVNKVDIVGFLSNKGDLKKDDIGLIEVKDFFSFVAIRKSKASHTLQSVKDQKIKGKKVRIDVAK